MTWPLKTHDAHGKPLTAKKLDALARNRASQAESRKRQRLANVPESSPAPYNAIVTTRRAWTARSSRSKLPDSPSGSSQSRSPSPIPEIKDRIIALPVLDSATPPPSPSEALSPNLNAACPAAGGGQLVVLSGRRQKSPEVPKVVKVEKTRVEVAREPATSSSTQTLETSSTQTLEHKPLTELERSIEFLAKRGPLQFPLPTNSLCYPGQDVFRLHALAAARQRGFNLSISDESTYSSFHLHCARGSNVRPGADRLPCPFEMEVRRTGEGWRCTKTFGRHFGHDVLPDDWEGNLLVRKAAKAKVVESESSTVASGSKLRQKRRWSEDDSPTESASP
ncbi:hypothetical protein RQP46_011132 [Phenoliferia psychrophenolica]